MRTITPPDVEHYRDRWDWLLRPTSEIAYFLPPWFHEGADAIGLPPLHPGVRLPA